MKKSKGIIIALLGVLVILVAVIIGLLVSGTTPEARFRRQLSLGDRYYTEMDYDRAIAAYSEALDIDPKNTDAMVALGDAYKARGEQYTESTEQTQEGRERAEEDLRSAHDWYKKALEDEKLPDKYRDEIEERIRDTEESQREIGSQPQPGPGSEPGEEPGAESGEVPENGQSEADPDRDAEILCAAYLDVVASLEDEYGMLRVSENDGLTETNGIVYLNLIDFNEDGIFELFAVCKNEGQFYYTGYIYTMIDGKAECIFKEDPNANPVTYGDGTFTRMITSGPVMYESVQLLNTDQHGYLIESEGGDDVDAAEVFFGFTGNGNDFEAVRYAYTRSEFNDDWTWHYYVDGEELYFGEGNPWTRMEEDRQAWTGAFAYDPAVIVRSTDPESLEMMNMHIRIDGTKELLGDTEKCRLLLLLREALREDGYVYNAHIDGTTLYADNYYLGYGNLSRRAWIEVDLATGHTIEKDSDGVILREYDLGDTASGTGNPGGETAGSGLSGALETAGLDFGQTPAPDVSGITIDAQDVMHFGGHSYYFLMAPKKAVDQPLTLMEAEAVCRALGGHLGTVTSREEQEFIGDRYASSNWHEYVGSWYAMLGAYRVNGGDWKWVTGESFSYTDDLPQGDAAGSGDGSGIDWIAIRGVSKWSTEGYDGPFGNWTIYGSEAGYEYDSQMLVVEWDYEY